MSKILFFAAWSEIRLERFGSYWYFFEKLKDDIVPPYVRGPHQLKIFSGTKSRN